MCLLFMGVCHPLDHINVICGAENHDTLYHIKIYDS